jgi:hypothetical protein
LRFNAPRPYTFHTFVWVLKPPVPRLKDEPGAIPP